MKIKIAVELSREEENAISKTMKLFDELGSAFENINEKMSDYYSEMCGELEKLISEDIKVEM